MTALVQALSRYRATTQTDIWMIVAMLCCAGLAAYFIRASYGLDLSAGFF